MSSIFPASMRVSMILESSISPHQRHVISACGFALIMSIHVSRDFALDISGTCSPIRPSIYPSKVLVSSGTVGVFIVDVFLMIVGVFFMIGVFGFCGAFL